jgi:hypothetical protein
MLPLAHHLTSGFPRVRLAVSVGIDLLLRLYAAVQDAEAIDAKDLHTPLFGQINEREGSIGPQYDQTGAAFFVIRELVG